MKSFFHRKLNQSFSGSYSKCGQRNKRPGNLWEMQNPRPCPCCCWIRPPYLTRPQATPVTFWEALVHSRGFQTTMHIRIPWKAGWNIGGSSLEGLITGQVRIWEFARLTSALVMITLLAQVSLPWAAALGPLQFPGHQGSIPTSLHDVHCLLESWCDCILLYMSLIFFFFRAEPHAFWTRVLPLSHFPSTLLICLDVLLFNYPPSLPWFHYVSFCLFHSDALHWTRKITQLCAVQAWEGLMKVLLLTTSPHTTV
jgi:hypothetical protein